MQAPDWFGRTKGPKGQGLPPPPNLFLQNASDSGAPGQKKEQQPPPPPSRPPPVPKGIVPPSLKGSKLADGPGGAPAKAMQLMIDQAKASQALALPAPLPVLAALPPPPRAALVQGSAAKAAKFHNEKMERVAKAKAKPGGMQHISMQYEGDQLAINLKDDILVAPGAKALAVNAAPRDAGAAEKAFMIPGLQGRPYDDEELMLVFSMIDLDKKNLIQGSDLRRIFDLCGEPEPSDAEIFEMIRLLDPDGNGSIDFYEFRDAFRDPPPLWRNFDLHRREEMGVDFDEGEEDEDDDQSSATPGSRPEAQEGRKVSTTTPQIAGEDPRLEAVKIITAGKKGLRPEFIKQVYQRFIDIDKEDEGFITYEVFCLVLRKVESPEMRRAFDIFDTDSMAELDLRHFIVGLSMFTNSSIQDKLRFAFMMYDEDQEEAIAREDLWELVKAMSPQLPEADRERHVNRMYAMNDLTPQMRIAIEEFTEYIVERAQDLVPTITSSSASQASASLSGSQDRTPPRSQMGSRY